MSDKLTYRIVYGYEPSTSYSPGLEWTQKIDIKDSVTARDCFTHLIHHRHEYKGQLANKVHLMLYNLVDEYIVSLIKTHIYTGEESLETHQESILEDRPHRELRANPGQEGVAVHGVAPILQGAWLVIEKSEDSGNEAVVGIARTTQGVSKLLDILTPVMDDTREILVKYFSFIEGTTKR